MDHVGGREASDDVADLLLESALQFGAGPARPLRRERDIGVDALALDRVRVAHDRGFGDRVVGDERAFDLGGAEPVPGHIEDVVDASRDPVVTVFVPAAAVPGEVVALVLCEVGLLEALMIAPHRARLARPRRGQAERSRHAIALEHATGLGFEHDRPDAEERQRGGARLGRRHTRQRCDQDAAGLGLPPRVDHGAAARADDIVVPAPDLGIDRLADRAEHAQAAPRVTLHRLVARLCDGSQRRGCGVEDRDPEIVDHAPVAARVRVRGGRFEHDRGRAVRERPI